jgi:hypothetical protein
MPNFDETFPWDPGYGAQANAARWRKMGKLWAPDGVVQGYLNQLNCTGTLPNVQIQTGAVFVNGYYAEVQNPQSFTMGTNGTIVAQVNYANEVAALIYRDTITDYGTGGFQQDQPGVVTTPNIWEIPIWGVSGGTTLLDLRNLINPATGLRWAASSPGATPVASNSTLQSSFGLARIPYAAQGFLHGTLLVTFSDMSQVQSAACSLTYQWGASDQQPNPITAADTITPANTAGFPAGAGISVPVSLITAVPVTQGKKTFGWRVTAGTGPGIQVSQMALSLWTGGRPPAA